MNIHSFKDVITSKRSALVNDVGDDFDEDEEREVAPMKKAIEGEEDEGTERFNDAGVPLEPFNLKNEREGGYFDENMNYVFKQEKGEVDAWVAGLSEDAIEAAIGEAALAEKKRKAKLELEEKVLEMKPRMTIPQLKEELLEYMEPGESISRTLRRLSGKEVVNNSGFKRRVNKNKVEVPKESQIDIARKNKRYIDRVTDIADQLITHGITGIYQLTREAIDATTNLWEYKGADGNIYGPFTSKQIAEWKSQGYLTGSTAVLLRKVQQKKTTSIYDDDDDDEDLPSDKRRKPNDDNWINSDDIDFGNPKDLDTGFSNEATAKIDLDEDNNSDSDEDNENKKSDQFEDDEDD